METFQKFESWLYLDFQLPKNPYFFKFILRGILANVIDHSLKDQIILAFQKYVSYFPIFQWVVKTLSIWLFWLRKKNKESKILLFVIKNEYSAKSCNLLGISFLLLLPHLFSANNDFCSPSRFSASDSVVDIFTSLADFLFRTLFKGVVFTVEDLKRKFQ